MRTDLFDFDLPDDRIALEPADPRDSARLLLVKPGDGLEDRQVRELPELLRPGDALVFNDTRVMRTALAGERWRDGNRARVSVNLHKRVDASRWRAFAQPAKRLAVGDRIQFGHDGRVCLLGTLDATVSKIGEAGEVELSFSMHSAYLDQAIEALGDPPLPPYIAKQTCRFCRGRRSLPDHLCAPRRCSGGAHSGASLHARACSPPWIRPTFPGTS